MEEAFVLWPSGWGDLRGAFGEFIEFLVPKRICLLL